MTTIHIKRAHELSRDEAKRRVERIAEDLKDKFNVQYHWKNDSLQFKRSGASGAIDLGDGFVEVKIRLGMMLAPMKGKIEASIKKNIGSFLT
jgi:putative polyhydroxyalkanoate system protein